LGFLLSAIKKLSSEPCLKGRRGKRREVMNSTVGHLCTLFIQPRINPKQERGGQKAARKEKVIVSKNAEDGRGAAEGGNGGIERE